MRKKLVLALLISVIALAASPVFARSSLSGMRFGVEFGNPSVVGILRFSMIDLKIGYDFTGLANNVGGNFLFIAGDIRVVNNYPLTGPLNFFLCAGAFVELMMREGGGGDNIFGLRLPVGINLLLFNNAVEIFVEIVPTLGIIPALEPLRLFQQA